jgi:hypothetical protein
MVYAGIDPLTRKQRYLKETTKTYAAAEVALTRLQSQVDDEKHPKTNINVAQAIEQWLDVAKLAETTRDRYDDLIRIYILPTFGNLPPPNSTRRSSSGSTRDCNGAALSATAGRAAGISASRSAAAPSGRSTTSSAARSSGRCGGGTSASTRLLLL